MPDPFILKERFRGVQQSNFSSAALSTNIDAAVTPGAGAAAAGREIQGVADEIHRLAVKQRNVANTLLAKKNTTRLAIEAQKLGTDLDKEISWDDATSSWGLKDEAGNNVSYFEAYKDRLTKLREGHKVGERWQDNEYERMSSNYFQSLLVQAAERGVQLDAERQKQNYSITIDEASNHSGNIIKEQYDKAKAAGIPLDAETLLIQNDNSISQYNDDLSTLDIGKKAQEELKLDTRSQFSEQLLNQMLLKEDIDLVEELLEKGLSQARAYSEGKDKGWEAGMRRGGSSFYLNPTALKSIQRRISTLRGKVPPGLGRQATVHAKNALAKIEIGEDATSDLNQWNNILVKRGNNVDADFEHSVMDANIATASDFAITKKKLATTPLNQHGNLIEGFHNDHITGSASSYAISLESRLAEESGALLKLYQRDPVAFALQNDDKTREATKALNEAKASGASAETLAPLGEKLIEARINFQNFYNPGSRRPLVYQTKEEIKAAVLALNLDAPNVAPNDLDRHVDEMKLFFDQYGQYGGQIYNELRDPKKYMDYKGDKLNPAVAAALVYGDTDVAVRIITAYNQKDDLFSKEQWQDQILQQLRLKINQSEELSQFMSSMGYVGYTDYNENDFVNIFQTYVLSLASQGNRMEVTPNKLTEYIQQAADDLITSKYATYENTTGGFLGLGRDVHYLSIPKEDNKGNPYNYDLSERAIETMKANPALIDRSLTNEEIAMIKSHGIFINNEDGTGFSLAYGGGKGVIDGKIDFKWKEFNSGKYQELFSVIPNNFSEEFNETIQLLGNAFQGPIVKKGKIEVIDYGKIEDPSLAIKLLNDFAVTKGKHQKAIAEDNLAEAKAGKKELDGIMTKIRSKIKHFLAAQGARADMIERNN